ncbi:MAG: hypothetical protein Fur0042_07930 [Cyanophyceae cyanobacterium]
MEDLAARVMALYGQVDGAIAAFQAAVPLACPAGCGVCCTYPEVEATPLEMLPLAVELFRRGEGELWLGRLETAAGAGICQFFAPDPLAPTSGRGRCTVYPWRPALCRLFGFATVVGKYGAPELAACARHKDQTPEGVAAAIAALAEDPSCLPSFGAITEQIIALDPSWGRDRLPINQAAQVALGRVGFWIQLSGQSPKVPER